MDILHNGGFLPDPAPTGGDPFASLDIHDGTGITWAITRVGGRVLAVPTVTGGGGSGVPSVDGITTAVTLVAGSNVTITDNSPIAGDITIAASQPSSLPPNGPAGGDLTGSYPNPTLVGVITAGGPIGDATHVPTITWDAKGRLTVVSSTAITFPVTQVFGRTGAVVAANGDYNGVVASALTGATAATRYVGATASGHPSTGTFAVGDFAVDQTGQLWICTAAGTPGTWAAVGATGNQVTSVFTRTGAVTAQSGDYTAAQVTNAADKSAVGTQIFSGALSTGPTAGAAGGGGVAGMFATTGGTIEVVRAAAGNAFASSLTTDTVNEFVIQQDGSMAWGSGSGATDTQLKRTAAQTLTAVSTGILSSSASVGIGYATGAGGTVTQLTSRTTGVTLNKICGAITLVSAAGSATWSTFTVTNSTVAATDTITIHQATGANTYNVIVSGVSAGSFKVSVSSVVGTATEAPVLNFQVHKSVTA